MKSPEIKDWDCIEYDPIGKWIPDDPAEVDFWLNMTIGIKGETGGDNFLVHIVTEKLISQLENRSHILVVPYYFGMNDIIERVNVILESCHDLNWSGMAEQISKIYYWEFESMR
ncbi:MAG: immunity 8 family protein [Pseudomonadales bacterium]|nr:immunity 8 family protein [Pseudomonadales bacterium]